MKSKKTESIVKPSIQIGEHVNPFIPHFDKELPELSAIGTYRMPGTNNYVSFRIKIKGNAVTEIVADEPNLKAIAVETAKIEFVNSFMSEDE